MSAGPLHAGAPLLNGHPAQQPSRLLSAVALSDAQAETPAASKPYTYVLVRQDISLEQQMVQACHAALEAGFAFEEPPTTSSLIVCTVPDLQALLLARERWQRYGIRSALFFEPSWDMGYSAMASEPLHSRKQRFAMSVYPLFRAPSSFTPVLEETLP